MKVKLSIVIPVYRSQTILPQVVSEVKRAAEGEEFDGAFELILVNDASPDDSWSVISDLAKTNPFVKGISLRKNFGQHSAVMAGLNYASGEVVIVMDDDLQHPPNEIGNLYRSIKEGADVCYTRYKNRKHALWKIIGSRFNDWVATILLKKPHGLYLSSFKAIHRDVVAEIIKYDGPYAYVDGLIMEVTRSISVIDIDHQLRHDGGGNYNLRRSVSLWLRMATSFSVFPLRIATVLGFALTFVSAVTIGILIIRKLLHPEIPAGWTSLIASILFVGGIQTFCIGVVGEYLGRAYIKINKKPQFSIREKTWVTGRES
jgi:undecaprenyl-phosphate 4-deoxy-4-formamido-L-arabinose transferase